MEADEYPTILFLPVEILELIMSMLSFHRDLPNVRLVCQLWSDVAKRVMERCRGKFINSLEKGQTFWSHLSQPVSESGSTLSPRFLHSACYYNRAMYVFGGYTSHSTCFNDIWKFDLCTNKWYRKYTHGQYPAPKAWASLVPHKGQLILFGGCTQSVSLLHEHSKIYNQVHVLDLKSDHWVLQDTIKPPDGRSGHQAGMIGDKMLITFGNDSRQRKCDDAWLLDFSTFEWTEVDVNGPKPQKRRGHSQAVLDDSHAVVMSGFGDRKEPMFDVWLLTLLEENEGVWRELKILGLPNSPPRTFGHAACQVDKKMVILGKIIKPCSQPSHVKKQQCSKCLHQHESSEPQRNFPARIGMVAAQLNGAQLRPNSRNDRDKRYEMLSIYEKRMKRHAEDTVGRQPTGSACKSPVENCTCTNDPNNVESYRNVHVLDLNSALTDFSASWLPVNKSTCADAGDYLFYSLVNCVNQITKFGGCQVPLTDDNGVTTQHTTNEISFLSHHLLSNWF